MTALRAAGRRVIDTIGPWRLRPVVLGIAMTCVFSVAIFGWTSGRTIVSEPSMALSLLPAALGGLLVGLVASVGRAWQRRHGIRWGSYLLAVLAMSLVSPVLRTVAPGLPHLPPGLIGIGTTAVRGALAVLLFSAIAGVVAERLDQQIAATEAALEEARMQQRQIIAADEEARRQAARLLHDRVQASLLTTCLELRMLADRLPDAERHEVARLVDRLEALRSLDLRSAIRSLSPNLSDVDLQTAIEDLAALYETSFAVEVAVDAGVDAAVHVIPEQVLLACYRIVEQGLVNVAAHAGASHVRVRVERLGAGLLVEVGDDGRGLRPDAGRGLGSAVVASWVGVTGGSWEWRPNPAGRGVVLRAELGDGA